MTSPTASSPPPPQPPHHKPKRGFRIGWAEAMVLTGILTMAMGGFVALRVVRIAQSTGAAAFESVGDAAGAAVEGITGLAAAFRSGTVESTFYSYASEAEGTTYLQFAKLDQMEVFQRTDSAQVLWGQLELPDVVVEARAPVQFTYYLDLGEPWSFYLEDDDLTVSAPRIRANRPAIDASKLTFEVREDSVLRDEDTAVEALRKGLTPMLEARAESNVNLVREIVRRRVEDFVGTWLARDFGEEARDLDIDVVFADEPAPAVPGAGPVMTPAESPAATRP